MRGGGAETRVSKYGANTKLPPSAKCSLKPREEAVEIETMNPGRTATGKVHSYLPYRSFIELSASQ